jgi:hypothetical protein
MMSGVDPVQPGDLYAEPIISKPIQDYLVYTYAQTAEQEMAVAIGDLGESMISVRKMLTSLNKIFSVASYRVPENGINYSAELTTDSSTLSLLWAARSDIVDGWNTISNMLAWGEVPSGTSGMISEIGHQPLIYVTSSNSLTTSFSHFIDLIQSTSPSTTYTNGGDAKDLLIAWYSGGTYATKTSSNSSKVWDTQTNLGNAVISYEYISNVLEYELQQAMLVFQSFSDATATMLSKIQKVLTNITNQIG